MLEIIATGGGSIKSQRYGFYWQFQIS
jgi:hypothetical protein